MSNSGYNYVSVI